jgi:hypothetical protein
MNLIFKFLWEKIGKNFKEALMYKTPVAVTIILLIACSYGCCNYFCPTANMTELVPQQYAEASRILTRARENADELGKLKAVIDTLGHPNASTALQAYSEGRNKQVKNLLTYINLELDEYKQMYRISHGDFSEKLEAVYVDLKKKIAEALAKLGE